MEIACVLQDAADSGIVLDNGKRKGKLAIQDDHSIRWSSTEAQSPGSFVARLTRILGELAGCGNFSAV